MVDLTRRWNEFEQQQMEDWNHTFLVECLEMTRTRMVWKSPWSPWSCNLSADRRETARKSATAVGMLTREIKEYDKGNPSGGFVNDRDDLKATGQTVNLRMNFPRPDRCRWIRVGEKQWTTDWSDPSKERWWRSTLTQSKYAKIRMTYG